MIFIDQNMYSILQRRVVRSLFESTLYYIAYLSQNNKVFAYLSVNEKEAIRHLKMSQMLLKFKCYF